MNHIFKLFTDNEINFSNLEQKQKASAPVIEYLKSKLYVILDQIKTNTFFYDSFVFLKNNKSGLTNVSGVYLIINRQTQKVYLGSTKNLAQRKGEHRLSLFDPTKSHKLLNSLKLDLETGKPTDFYFVPLCGFPKTFATKHFEQKEFQDFLDRQIEMLILTEFLNEQNPYSSFFYNVKTLGVFEIQNKYGGSFLSGLPSQAIMFENYA